MAQFVVTGVWFVYCIHKFRDSPMTYSMSTDLETGNIVWTLNNGTNTTGLPSLGLPAHAIAGLCADLYKDEALSKIPSFE